MQKLLRPRWPAFCAHRSSCALALAFQRRSSRLWAALVVAWASAPSSPSEPSAIARPSRCEASLAAYSRSTSHFGKIPVDNRWLVGDCNVHFIPSFTIKDCNIDASGGNEPAHIYIWYEISSVPCLGWLEGGRRSCGRPQQKVAPGVDVATFHATSASNKLIQMSCRVETFA